MAEHYRQWHQSCRELAQHQQQSQERTARAELLEYQLKELNEFNPQAGEFEQIDEEYKRLANSGQLLSTSQNALNMLADGEDVNLQSQLYNVRQLVTELTGMDNKLSGVLEMLEEAVSRLKGEPAREEVETELSIGLPAFIPDTYISDAGQRLKYYKTLASMPDERGLHDVELELRDLYGALPAELSNFMAVLALKLLLCKLQVAKADVFGEKLKLTWPETVSVIDPSRLVNWVAAANAAGARVRLLPPAGLEYELDPGLPIPERLNRAAQNLRKLLADA